MFEENSKINNALLTFASIMFLINIFISVLNYVNYGHGISLGIIIVSTIALLINFRVWTKDRKTKKHKMKSLY